MYLLYSSTELNIINEEIEAKDAPLRKGTIIEVEELFYNTPARLKYLKTDYTENANSIEIMSRLALAHPEVAIKVYMVNVNFKLMVVMIYLKLLPIFSDTLSLNR